MNKMKGIILAGGTGSRLYPATLACSKQLFPIYDKPMIFYPLSVLMLANIREIALISTPKDISFFQELLKNGSQWGINIEYIVQEKPEGIAQALVLAENFIGNSSVALILGDNIFWGHGFSKILENVVSNFKEGCSIFAYQVNEPFRYGIVEFDKNFQVLSLEEKPIIPKSNWAITGLYMYDSMAVQLAKTLQPSLRNELEITDLNKEYFFQKKLYANILGRGFAWLDTGTHSSLLEASSFIHTIEKNQGVKIACLEEIAFVKSWIDKQQLQRMSAFYVNSDYGNYLKKIIQEIHE